MRARTRQRQSEASVRAKHRASWMLTWAADRLTACERAVLCRVLSARGEVTPYAIGTVEAFWHIAQNGGHINE